MIVDTAFITIKFGIARHIIQFHQVLTDLHYHFYFKIPELLYTRDNIPLAFDKQRGKPPVIVYVPGFLSHMEDTKALWLAQRCQAFLRFDDRGHGSSGGDFKACRKGSLSLVSGLLGEPLVY